MQARQNRVDELTLHGERSPAHREGGVPDTVTGLPVLEAFQRFVEAERRRSRNRMIVLTAVFAGILLLVGALSVVVGTIMYRKAQKNIAHVEQNVSDMKDETRGIRNETRSIINRTAVSLQKGQLKLAKHSKATADDVGRMATQVEELESRNAALVDQLNSVRQILPSLSSDLRLVVNLMEDMRPMEPELVEPLLATPETITMLISPRGSDESIPWRLPIPE
ncbi:MAG: hypothetical protein QF886_18800 [Planctomycetota bacterium]|nr:hypothetical protein [Planctomycetota bacterium]